MTAGEIDWRELITTDSPAAKSFYLELLDWNLRDRDLGGDFGHYGMIYVATKPVSGFDRTDGSELLPHWLPYIQVPDSVEAATERAIAAGGNVIQRPHELHDIGRAATLTDPDGEVFVAFDDLPDSTNADTSVDWPPPNGAVSWYAVVCKDGPKTAAFYRSVFGYTADHSELTGTSDEFLVLSSGGEMRAGILVHIGDIRCQWLLYFAVPDVEATQKRALELGGTVVTPVMAIPEVGRIVGLLDPAGAAFCAHELEP